MGEQTLEFELLTCINMLNKKKKKKKKPNLVLPSQLVSSITQPRPRDSFHILIRDAHSNSD